MKNKITVLLALSLVMFVAIGCGIGNLLGSKEETSTSKDSGSKSAESTTEGKKEVEPSGKIVEIGITECDELATYINDNAEAIGSESIVVRGIVEMYKQTIFSKLRDSVKEMTDEQKTKTAANCKKAFENLKEQMNK